MVITVEELFKEIMSAFPGPTDQFDSRQIFNLINQSYVDLRDQYIRAGQGEEFALSETISTFTASNFSYFSKATLSNQVLQSVPLDTAIVSTFVRIVPELTDAYTLSKTFEPEDVRNYTAANGLKYFQGDVVFEDGVAYRAINTIIATSTDPLSAQSDDWEPVYWMKKGIGQVNAEVVDYKRIDRHKVSIDTGAAVVTALKDQLFVSKNVNSIVIEYIAEHSDVSSFVDTLVLPDGARKLLRDMVIQHLIRETPRMQSQPQEDEQ